MFDGDNQRPNHLIEGHQSEAPRRCALRWNRAGDRVHRNEEVRPPMPWSKHVPWPQNGGGQAGVRNGMFPG